MEELSRDCYVVSFEVDKRRSDDEVADRGWMRLSSIALASVNVREWSSKDSECCLVER